MNTQYARLEDGNLVYAPKILTRRMAWLSIPDA